MLPSDHYFGTYEASGSTITISDFESKEMYCMEPDGALAGQGAAGGGRALPGQLCSQPVGPQRVRVTQDGHSAKEYQPYRLTR
jgi:hypothetical protein